MAAIGCAGPAGFLYGGYQVAFKPGTTIANASSGAIFSGNAAVFHGANALRVANVAENEFPNAHN